jgi:hypothetical protein
LSEIAIEGVGGLTQTAWVGPKVVMLEKPRTLMDVETDRCVEVARSFLLLAEKERSAFICAVDQFVRRWAGLRVGAGLDRGAGTYGSAVSGIDSRLASGYGGRKYSAWRFIVRPWTL